MAQDQDFCFQPLLRLEAVAQHAEKQEADCDPSTDHVLIRRQPRVQMDGVFRSNSYLI